MTISWLLGIRDIGNVTDFPKIKSYGFLYWLAMPQTPTGLEIQNILNGILFNTFQEITLPSWPISHAEQATYAGVKIQQPVPAGIGAEEGFTLKYLDVITPDASNSYYIDMANTAFLKWMYNINIAINKGLVVGHVLPTMRTAACAYVLLSPDLTEIWGGEIFGGVVLEKYTPNFSYQAGQNTVRSVEAQFKFQERIPIFTVMNGQPLNEAFAAYQAELVQALTLVQQQAQSIFTLA